MVANSQKAKIAQPKQKRRWLLWLVLILGGCLLAGSVWIAYDWITFRPAGVIAYECRYEICVVDANGRNLQTIPTDSVLPQSPTWSPDGQLLTFVGLEKADNQSCYANGQPYASSTRSVIYTYAFIAPKATILWYAPECSHIFHVAWAPNGKQLALNARINDKSGIYVLETDQEPMELRLLAINTTIQDPNNRPAFSRDGNQIYYAADPVHLESSETYMNMNRIKLDGSGREEIGSLCHGISISADGLRVACSRNVPTYKMIINATDWSDAGVNPNWSILLSGFRDPAWSPDSQYIVYSQTHWPAFMGDHNGELWIMRADGSHPTKLTNGPSDRNPAWRPEP